MFLVKCLLSHMDDPEIVHVVLALNYLEQASGAMRVVQLKRSGDASLILAGLFPERASRLRVDSSYFRVMGQMFYANLAAYLEVGPTADQGHFFAQVALHFETLERVLRGTRGRAVDEWTAYRRFRIMLN